MNIRSLRTILTAGLLLAAAATRADAPKVIRLGLVGNKYNKPFTTSVFGFAQQRQAWEKEFAKEGIKIEWNFFTATGPAINEAVANGTLDIASSGDLPSIIGRSGGLPTKVILPTGIGGGKNYVIVQSNSALRTLQDLKGKRITFQKGTYFHLLWDRLAKYQLGATEKDFKIYSLTSGDQDVALASGQVDAELTNSTDLVDRGVGRILYTIDFDDNPKLSNFGNIYATEDFIRKYPDIVQRFVDVYVKIAAEVLTPQFRNEYNKQATSSGVSLKNVLATQARDNEFSWNPAVDAYYLKRLRSAIDDAKEYGLVRRTFEPKDWLDTRFLDKALKEQGLDARWKDLRTPALSRLE